MENELNFVIAFNIFENEYQVSIKNESKLTFQLHHANKLDAQMICCLVPLCAHPDTEEDRRLI